LTELLAVAEPSSGNAAGITLMNSNGGVINVDIVIPTACGAIFACQFI